MDQNGLLDPHLYKVITRCFINNKGFDYNEISVRYEDGIKETIWTYKPALYSFDFNDFIGMTKIEAVFYCDRMKQRNWSELWWKHL